MSTKNKSKNTKSTASKSAPKKNSNPPAKSTNAPTKEKKPVEQPPTTTNPGANKESVPEQAKSSPPSSEPPKTQPQKLPGTVKGENIPPPTQSSGTEKEAPQETGEKKPVKKPVKASDKGWKVSKVKKTKEDKELRKKRNEKSKENHEKKARFREMKKKRFLEAQQDGGGHKKTSGAPPSAHPTGFSGTKKKTTNKDYKKPSGDKKDSSHQKDIKKCAQAETKEGCDDLFCVLYHRQCDDSLDCNKKHCLKIHLEKYLDYPDTREESLHFLRVYQFIREQSLVHPKKKAMGRLTFDKLMQKLLKSHSPAEGLIKLRCDWTWRKWAEALEKANELAEGTLTGEETKESDLAQFFELFYNDLHEHWYIHSKNYSLEEEKEKGDEEEEEPEEVHQFDEAKIDEVLKQANGKTFRELLNGEFVEFNEEKKILQTVKCWKLIFLARVTKVFISLEETESVLLLDNLIGLIENGKKENEVTFERIKFEVDPELMALSDIDCDIKLKKAWVKFFKSRKPAALCEYLLENLGATPIVHGHQSFPSLSAGIKYTLDVFHLLSEDPSIQKQVNTMKKAYQRMPWVFTLAEILEKKEGDFFVYEKIEDAKYWGSLYKEFKQKIQETWK